MRRTACQVCNPLCVVRKEPKKAFQLWRVFGDKEVHQCLDSARIRAFRPSSHDVTEHWYCLTAKNALSFVQRQTLNLGRFQEVLQIFLMYLHGSASDDHIVKIWVRSLQVVPAYKGCHFSLKCSYSVCDAKGKSSELKKYFRSLQTQWMTCPCNGVGFDDTQTSNRFSKK